MDAYALCADQHLVFVFNELHVMLNPKTVFELMSFRNIGTLAEDIDYSNPTNDEFDVTVNCQEGSVCDSTLYVQHEPCLLYFRLLFFRNQGGVLLQGLRVSQKDTGLMG